MLKVHYELTFDDYIEYSLRASRKLPVHKWVILKSQLIYLFVFLGITVGVFFLPGTWFPPPGGGMIKAAVVVLGPLCGVALCLVSPNMYWTRLEAAVRAITAQQGWPQTQNIELALTEEVLVEVARSVRSEIKWEDMKGVEVFGDTTVIAVTSSLAAIIPRHGFEEDRDYFAVRDFALRKLDGELPRDD